MKILKVIGIVFVAAIALYVGAVIWSTMSHTYSIFARKDQIKATSGEQFDTGLYKTELNYEWGKISIKSPIESSRHNRSPHNPPGKFTMSVIFYDLLDPSIKFIRLKKIEFVNVQPNLEIQQIDAKHSSHDKPVLGADGRRTQSMIADVPFYFFVLDIPKKVKSFEMDLEIEIEKGSGVEVVKFQETFYRTTYLSGHVD